MINEKWKDIEGYTGLYQISTLGNIKNTRSGNLLRPQNARGYLRVKLHKHGEFDNIPVHRLVAQAFIPNPENKPQVNHIDEDKTNNTVDNLEWVTAKETCNYGTRNERVSKSKYKAVECSNGIIYESMLRASQELNIPPAHISRVCRGLRKSTRGYSFKYAEVSK